MELQREQWKSKLGIILAVAGSAVGLGNFLRFPGLVAQHGGAFMIPYFISLLLLGLPLMWIEWTFGRYGGGFGHSTAPGVFHSIRQKNRFIKYFGVIGILGPLLVFVFYTYIESWLLGYSFISLFDGFKDVSGDQMGTFLGGYSGQADTNYFPHGLSVAYTVFALTFLINISVVWKGLTAGIEKLCQWAMPLLFLLAIILVVRIFTLQPPAGHPERTVTAALNTMWNPDLAKLKDTSIWLDAAGQVFFSLSVGFGVILTYASYLKKDDDVALSGLTAASANTFAEVILGASIVIPAAFMFLGPEVTTNYVNTESSIQLGMLAMPQALAQMPLHNVFGFVWFFLLFLAGVTSSISLAQPAIAFLEDEFNLTRQKAVAIFAAVTFGLCNMVILWQAVAIEEFNFWAATLIIIIFGLVEAILAGWVFGIDKIWNELHSGSDIRIPRVYRFIIKYITPTLILAILVTWLYQKGMAHILLNPDLTSDKKTLGDIANVLKDPARKTQVIIIRLVILGCAVVLCGLVGWAWRGRDEKNYPELDEETPETQSNEEVSS